jgi:uncharacterized membrane protein
MADEAKKSLGILSRIEKHEDAVKVVHAASLAFFVVAGLLLIMSYFFGRAFLFDAVAFLVLGFFLRQFKSRIVAILLLLLAVITTAVAVGRLMEAGIHSGIYIIVAVVVLWAAIRAVEATFKMRRQPPGAK